MAALRTPRRLQHGRVEPNCGGDHKSKSTVGVVVAAPHVAFRHGIRACLGLDFKVVGEAASVAELEEVFSTGTADLLLVDEDLPGGGFRAAIELADPSAKIVVFADEARGEQVIDVLRLGASGYLLKNISPKRVGITLRAVMDGEPALTRTLLRALVDEIVRTDGSTQLTLRGGQRVMLTPRERQVAALIKQGQSTREIASVLGVSEVTARRHISGLMQKLSVETRAQAIDALTG